MLCPTMLEYAAMLMGAAMHAMEGVTGAIGQPAGDR